VENDRGDAVGEGRSLVFINPHADRKIIDPRIRIEKKKNLLGWRVRLFTISRILNSMDTIFVYSSHHSRIFRRQVESPAPTPSDLSPMESN